MDFWTALGNAFGSQAMDLRGRLLTDGDYVRRSADSIRRIVVHHTAVDASRSWAVVAAYHVNGNNWPGIGYHLGIARDGALSYLGDIGTVRYHAGRANADSIGVCFAGNFETDVPTAAALATFDRLYAVLDAYIGRGLEIVGHRDVGQTACPGRNLYAVLFGAQLLPLPAEEPLLPPAVLAEKVRWWLEEYTRMIEAGDTARAEAILTSLIALDGGLLYRLENALKSGAAVG